MTALAKSKMSSFEKWGQKQFTLTSGKVAYKNGAAGIKLGTGRVEPMAQAPDMLYIGKFYEDMDATSAAKLVNVDLENVLVDWFVNSGSSPVLATDLGALCYFVDDTTVEIAPGAGSVAGRVWGVDTLKGVAVQRLSVGAGAGGGVLPENALPAFSSNNSNAPAIAGIYDIPTTAAASTVTLPAAGVEGQVLYFVADGTKNGHTVTYRDATGPVSLTTALTASKRHLVVATFLNGLWFANAYVSP